jgi:hypothetical protein
MLIVNDDSKVCHGCGGELKKCSKFTTKDYTMDQKIGKRRQEWKNSCVIASDLHTLPLGI